MREDRVLVFLVFFVLSVFLIGNANISGKSVSAKNRFCVDSDNGISPYSPGNVRSDIGIFYDWCFENLNEIREYYCVAGRLGGKYQVESKVVRCGSGFTCRRNIVGNADSCIKS